jgi:hypothetical protein
MSTTFAAFVAIIQGEGNDSSTRMKTLIERWVNEEHYRICTMKDWDFLIVDKSDSTSIAVAAIPFDIATIKLATITTPARRIFDVRDTTDGSEYPLWKATIQEISARYPSYVQSTGTPEYWFYENNNKVNFWPKLDATRTFVFTYLKAAKTYTTGSADNLLIPDEWLKVLIAAVMERFWKYRTDDRFKFAKDDYDSTISDMCKAAASRAGILYATNVGPVDRMPRLVVP